jgi:hypothetical protein
MPLINTVATLGPATDSPGISRQLLPAGANIFRLNASHGNVDGHAARVHAVRTTAKELGIHAGILLDLQGPKIRLGCCAEGGCTLAQGAELTITAEPVLGRACSGSRHSGLWCVWSSYFVSSLLYGKSMSRGKGSFDPVNTALIIPEVTFRRNCALGGRCWDCQWDAA